MECENASVRIPLLEVKFTLFAYPNAKPNVDYMPAVHSAILRKRRSEAALPKSEVLSAYAAQFDGLMRRGLQSVTDTTPHGCPLVGGATGASKPSRVLANLHHAAAFDHPRLVFDPWATAISDWRASSRHTLRQH